MHAFHLHKSLLLPVNLLKNCVAVWLDQLDRNWMCLLDGEDEERKVPPADVVIQSRCLGRMDET